MFKKIIEKAKQPKKPITVNLLLKLLLAQGFMLLFVLIVIVIWPERAASLSTFLFMAAGISFGLWLDIREAGVLPKSKSVITEL